MLASGEQNKQANAPSPNPSSSFQPQKTYRMETATATHDPHVASPHVAKFAATTGRSQRRLAASRS